MNSKTHRDGGRPTGSAPTDAHRRTLGAEGAERWGLVTQVVPDDEVMIAARAAMDECREMAPEARAGVKRSIDGVYPRYDRMSVDISLRGDEVLEGMCAFRERRRPNWVRD